MQHNNDNNNNNNNNNNNTSTSATTTTTTTSAATTTRNLSKSDIRKLLFTEEKESEDADLFRDEEEDDDSNNGSSNEEANDIQPVESVNIQKRYDLIEKLLPDTYPSTIALQISRAPETKIFGLSRETKEVKWKLGMHDKLQHTKATKAFLSFLASYEQSLKKKPPPKHGQPTFQTNVQVFHYFYIQYMSLVGRPGNFKGFVNSMPTIIALISRLVKVLNKSEYKVNAVTIFKRFKQAINAVSMFAQTYTFTRINESSF